MRRAAWIVIALMLLGSAQAAVDIPPNRINIGKLQYGGGGDWYVGPSSIPNLLKTLSLRLGLDTADDHVAIKPDDESIFNLPLVYFTGHGNIRFLPKEREVLRRYVSQGGFLWANDDFGMDKSLRKELPLLFPGTQLVEIPYQHPIYHMVYDFPNGPPKIHEHNGKRPQALGIFWKGRLVFLYTFESDIGDGMEDIDVYNDPPAKHEAALRFGINVVTFALSY